MDEKWDVIVIGAGPAGSVAAYELARNDVSVLLIDKAKFPRYKVCGSCLNQNLLSTLQKLGLESIISTARAQKLKQFCFMDRNRSFSFTLKGSVALSREKFDMSLINAACEQGVTFLQETRAVTQNVDSECRSVVCVNQERVMNVKAKVVLVCDGLAGGAFAQESQNKINVDARSRIGIGTILEQAPEFYHDGIIYMIYDSRSYLGMVRLEDGRLNLAAAVDPSLVKADMSDYVAILLKEMNLPALELSRARWHGTPPLTRRRSSVADVRLFFLGDAAGYTEPFTGEGMAWAVEGAVRLVPMVLRALDEWKDLYIHEWCDHYAKTIHRKQMLSSWMSKILRNPAWTKQAAAIAQKFSFA